MSTPKFVALFGLVFVVSVAFGLAVGTVTGDVFVGALSAGLAWAPGYVLLVMVTVRWANNFRIKVRQKGTVKATGNVAAGRNVRFSVPSANRRKTAVGGSGAAATL
jgi:hypothetical protein